MKAAKGFTLIELITTIMIMGMLSSTAMIKLSSIKDDARAASIDGIAANLRTAIDMIYLKSAIQGVQDNCSVSDRTEVAGYFVCHGYPLAYTSSIKRLMNIDTNSSHNRLHVHNAARPSTHPGEQRNLVLAITIIKGKYSYTERSGYCQVLYQPHETPQIVAMKDGC